jgi:hypothetical protein
VDQQVGKGAESMAGYPLPHLKEKKKKEKEKVL